MDIHAIFHTMPINALLAVAIGLMRGSRHRIDDRHIVRATRACHVRLKSGNVLPLCKSTTTTC